MLLIFAISIGTAMVSAGELDLYALSPADNQPIAGITWYLQFPDGVTKSYVADAQGIARLLITSPGEYHLLKYVDYKNVRYHQADTTGEFYKLNFDQGFVSSDPYQDMNWIVFDAQTKQFYQSSRKDNNIIKKAVSENSWWNNQQELVSEYLSKNRGKIGASDSIAQSGFKLMDSDIVTNRVFLLGEFHGTREAYELELAAIKYFNEKAGIQRILMEMGPADSYYYNKFLRTGDTAALKLVFANYCETSAYNKDNYEFWLKLKIYNDNLPPNSKLCIAGLDVQHQLSTGFACLNELLACDSIPAPIAQNVATVRSVTDDNNGREAIEILQADMNSEHAGLYRTMLGDKWFETSLIVDACKQAYDFYAREQDVSDLRDNFMFTSFMRNIAKYPGEKWCGQFGSYHTILKTPNSARFAEMIADEPLSPVKGKVIVCNSLSKDSYGMYSVNGKYYSGKEESTYIDPFTNNSLGKLTLFKLNSAHSPFFEIPAYTVIRDFDYAERTSNPAASTVGQYLILIENSPASQPYGDAKLSE